MKCNVILTCQLAMALHMKTSELSAPDGFAFTWKRKQIVDIQAQIQLLMQVYTRGKGSNPNGNYHGSNRIPLHKDLGMHPPFQYHHGSCHNKQSASKIL